MLSATGQVDQSGSVVRPGGGQRGRREGHPQAPERVGDRAIEQRVQPRPPRAVVGVFLRRRLVMQRAARERRGQLPVEGVDEPWTCSRMGARPSAAASWSRSRQPSMSVGSAAIFSR